MNTLAKFVSLHPYFDVRPGKMDAIKAMLPRFVEKTATEKGNLFYEFTMNGDKLFCREAYENADGLLAHFDNVGALLAEAMKVAGSDPNRSARPSAGIREIEKAAGTFETEVVRNRTKLDKIYRILRIADLRSR